jgi:hypothetical protein
MVLVFVQTSCCGYPVTRREGLVKENASLDERIEESERLLNEEEAIEGLLNEEEAIEEVDIKAETPTEAATTTTVSVLSTESETEPVMKRGSEYNDVAVSESAQALHTLQAEQKAKRDSQIVTVHKWNDEGDFELFLYLKLDELIRDGKAGFNAVNVLDEEGKERKDKVEHDCENDERAYESETNEIAPAYSETAQEAEQLPDYPPPEYNDLPDSKDTFLDDEKPDGVDDGEGYESSLSDVSLETPLDTPLETPFSHGLFETPYDAMPVKSEDEVDEIDVKENVAPHMTAPPSKPTKPTQLEKESEKLNDQILSMIQDATRALDTHWADYLDEPDCDFEDDIGADLDYLALLNSMPSPAEAPEFDEEFDREDGGVRTMLRSSLTKIMSIRSLLPGGSVSE